MASRRKKAATCLVHDCGEPPFLGGYCRLHHEERAQAEREQNEARTLIRESTVDGAPVTDAALKEELSRLQSWWYEAVDALRFNSEKRVPKDEAEFALSWCLSLAKEMVKTERLRRQGDLADPYSLFAARHWVWDRFKNLEAGLRSNGLPRKKEQ